MTPGPGLHPLQLSFTIRLFLPNGEQSVQLCQGSSTILSLKQLVLKKKRHCFAGEQTEADIVVRIAIAKLFILHDQDTITSVLSHWSLFRESNETNLIPDLVIFPKVDINDSQKIADMKANTGEPIMIMGLLWRKRKNSSKFKKQYCVLQSFTLFSYDSESDYKKNRPARNVYPLGACQFMALNVSPFTLQIAVENHCPGKALILKSFDDAEFQSWIKALETLSYRYAKCQLLRLTDMLEVQFGLDSEGIFRVAGSLPCMQALRRSCEKGAPELDVPVDEHSICSMIKTIVRQLNPPLFTYTHFDDFIRLANSADRSTTAVQKCGRLKYIFNMLPATHLALCEYLVEFLHRVSLRSSSNKMNNYNLGVVFGPNILRRAEYLANDTYCGTQQQDLVAFIIENQAKIFQKHTCLDFLSHKTEDIEKDNCAPPQDAPKFGESYKMRGWSYINPQPSVVNERIELSPPTDCPEKEDSSLRDQNDSDDDEIISINFFNEMSSIHAEWDEHLSQLWQSMLDQLKMIEDTRSNKLSPILLANLNRCIEVEKEWRSKAERNGTFMMRILSQMQKQLE